MNDQQRNHTLFEFMRSLIIHGAIELEKLSDPLYIYFKGRGFLLNRFMDMVFPQTI